MDPEAPPAPPPMMPSAPDDQSQYDFIFKGGQKPKKSLLPSGNSPKQRLILVGVGGLILITLIIIVAALIFGGSGGNTEQLVGVAKQQNELIRLSGIGVEKAQSAEARNLAITAKLSLTSEQPALLSALKAQGHNLPAKELAASQNAATDKLLTEAEQSNRFDEVFFEKLQTDLVNYQQALKKAFDSTTNQKTKQVLSTQFQNATLLANIKEG